MRLVTHSVQHIPPGTIEKTSGRRVIGVLMLYRFVDASRTRKPFLIKASSLDLWIGSLFSNSSSNLIRDPITPLALCAQTESAEMRSSRSDNMSINCRSDCGSDIMESVPNASRTRNHQIRRLNAGRPRSNFTSILSILQQKMTLFSYNRSVLQGNRI